MWNRGKCHEVFEYSLDPSSRKKCRGRWLAGAFTLPTILVLALCVSCETSKSPNTPNISAKAKTQSGPEVALKYRHEASSIAFSPDSSILASSSFGTIRLTDIQTGRLVRIGEVDGCTPISMAFSPDGNLLVAGTSGGKVEVLNVRTLVKEQVLPVTRWGVYAVAVSPDSATVACCAADGTVQLWDIKSARKLRSFGAKGDRMASIVFSSDGKLLATLGRYGRCNVWSVTTGKLKGTFSTGSPCDEDSTMCFLPDGRLVVATSGINAICFWDPVKGGQPIKIAIPEQIRSTPRMRCLEISPGARPINAPLIEVIYSHSRSAVSSNGQICATVLENGAVAIWDIAKREVLRILPTGHVPNLFGGGVRKLYFSPDGHQLATLICNGFVDVWRVDGKGKPAGTTQPIKADEWPGPWGPAINGLRTRLLFKPVKPGKEALALRGRSIGRWRIPVSEGVWWEVCLQVRNEEEVNSCMAGDTASGRDCDYPRGRPAGGLPFAGG